ncbi:MAG: Omp28-related outer membrane protein [candidate division WOR-3 bacterium]|nr:Omp28-related outer membrane protein [candidate division WOR-3 bacterium]
MAVEWHVSSSYPLYSAEGRAKWFMYPPPYNGSYATPWLWVDGRQRGYNYNLWASYVAAQITVPTPVQITVVGSYDQSSRNGTIKALIQNDSTDDITARVSVVITEDSCYYAGPNGDPWHNHVCRDYIPNQSGTVLTIPAGGMDSVEQPFTIASNWNEERCKVVVYAQSTTMVPADSSYPVFQGAEVRVLDLVGVKEEKPARAALHSLRVTPNPCRGRASFQFATTGRAPYEVAVLSSDGRLVERFAGVAEGETSLKLRQSLAGGVYLYRVVVAGKSHTGKLVVYE